MYWDRCKIMNEILSSSIFMPRMKLKGTTDIEECHPPDCSSLRYRGILLNRVTNVSVLNTWH